MPDVYAGGAAVFAWARRHSRALDTAFVVVLAVLLVLRPTGETASGESRSLAVRVILAALFAGPLLLRWRLPRTVFGLLVLGTLVSWPVDGAYSGHLVLPFAGYAMTVTVERSAATRVALAGLLALLIPTAVWAVRDSGGYEVAEAVAWTALGCALGMAVASQRRYFREAREHVRAAEQSREEEAARRVAEERLRISRELHDVIAHHISVINVQASVAEHLLRTDSGGAEQALRNVRESAQTVLGELGGVLAVLRQEPGAQDPRAPAPGLAQIPALVKATEEQGHEVSMQVDGEASGAPGGVQLTAYRVVQEALTNLHKHAPSAVARVRLAWEPHRLIVSVVNDPPYRAAPAAAGNGLGLIGMRERVAAIGGVLTTGALPEGGYSVRADLPLDRGRS